MENATQMCPQCHKINQSVAIYCQDCGSQIRCESCGSAWFLGAAFCIRCGKKFGSVGSSIPQSVETISASNYLKYEETETTKAFEARITDSAAANIGGLLGFVMGNKLASKQTTGFQKIITVPNDEEARVETDRRSSLEVPKYDSLLDGSESEDSKTESQTTEILSQFFSCDGKFVSLSDTRLKQSSHLDANRRLYVLGLLAFEELASQDKVTRQELFDLARALGWYNANSHKVMVNGVEFIIRDEFVKLSGGGRELSKKYVRDLLDDSLVTTWFGPSGSKTKPAKNKDAASDGSSTGRRKSKRDGLTRQEAKFQAAWRAKRVPEANHDTVRNFGALDQALVGLWAIRVGAGEESSVVGTKNLSSFIESEFEIKVTESTLRSVLQKEHKYVLDKGTTRFQINLTGVKYVNDLLGIHLDLGLNVNGGVDN